MKSIIFEKSPVRTLPELDQVSVEEGRSKLILVQQRYRNAEQVSARVNFIFDNLLSTIKTFTAIQAKKVIKS